MFVVLEIKNQLLIHPDLLPAALREPARAKLDQLEKMKIIKVPVGEPTAWCSALHAVHKILSGPEQDVHVGRENLEHSFI